MEDDSEITLRLPPVSEPRYNLRYQQKIPEASAKHTSGSDETESGMDRASITRRIHSARTPGTQDLKAELKRINVHIAEVKSHLHRRSQNRCQTSSSKEQLFAPETTRSNEPSAGHSGFVEQLGPTEPTLSLKPSDLPSGSAEQLSSGAGACSSELLSGCSESRRPIWHHRPMDCVEKQKLLLHVDRSAVSIAEDTSTDPLLRKQPIGITSTSKIGKTSSEITLSISEQGRVNCAPPPHKERSCIM
jgi:hypothetical protein